MQAAIFLSAASFMLLIESLVLKDSNNDPVFTECSSISPEIEDEAMTSSLLNQAMEETAPVWINLATIYLFFCVCQILTVLFTDPAAM